MKRILLLGLLLFLVGCGAVEVKKECKSDNFSRVSAKGECLRIITENKIKNPRALVVLIHGDGSRGGPSDYLSRRAYKTNPEANRFVVVSLIRPGYFDSKGNYSTGSSNNRRDNYTRYNVDVVASALKNLNDFYKPKKLIVAGHSGGAAIAGNIIGKYPLLVDGAVLAACPCNIPRWRASRNSSWTSLSPSTFAGNVKNTKVIAIAGADDTNTFSSLMSNYINRLKKNGVDAEFKLLTGVSHNGTARSDEFFSSIVKLSK